jgi:hypothetical protein
VPRIDPGVRNRAHPDFVVGIVPAIPSPRSPGGCESLDASTASRACDPNRKVGHQADRGGVLPMPTPMLSRVDALKLYDTDAGASGTAPIS